MRKSEPTVTSKKGLEDIVPAWKWEDRDPEIPKWGVTTP